MSSIPGQVNDPVLTPFGIDEQMVLEWLKMNQTNENLRQRIANALGLPVDASERVISIPDPSLLSKSIPDEEEILNDPEHFTERLDQYVNRSQRKQPIEFDSVESALSQGLEKMLEQIKKHLPAAYEPPSIDVSFQDLRYVTDISKADGKVASVISQLIEMIYFFRPKKTVQKDILNNLTGNLRSGTATLVIGPPRSGKSAFMKVLSGRAFTNSKCKVSGRITYNGEDTIESGMKLPRLISYIPQRDEHIPEMTVRETITFATDCNKKKKIDCGEISKLETMKVQILLTLLGIAHVADTVVGNELLRGISGGQRKRVTSAEMMVAFNPIILADEISTGLDSASTLDVCKTLCTIAHTMNSTVVISLLQPPPDVYNLFDNILIFTNGRIAYHGPRTSVLDYFRTLGFVCPEHKDVADFLQEITTDLGSKYAIPNIPVPTTPEEFASAFQKSSIHKEMMYDESKPKSVDDVYKEQLKKDYCTSYSESFKILIKREFLLLMRNKAYMRTQIIQSIVMGVLAGTLFYQMDADKPNLHYGILFFTLMSLALGGMSSIPKVIEQRTVAYKQMAAGFFPPSSYAIASALSQWPMAILETILLGTIVYWLSGLAKQFTHYLFALLLMFTCKLAMTSYFRFLAVVSPNASTAQSMGATSVLLLVLFAGYLITKGNIKSWWIWMYYVSPLSYAFLSLSQNEFLSPDYDVPISKNIPDNKGKKYLETYDLSTNQAMQWLGLVYLAGFYILFTVLFSVILKYLRWPETFPDPPESTNDDKSIEMGTSKSLSFQPVTLSFHEVSYAVDLPGEKGKHNLTLLNKVSGFAKPGTMTALMGSSGAGKTTLMDVLAGRKNSGRINGSILLNGYPTDPISFNRIAGYVEQMDIHSPMATVLEALRFSARLRLAKEITDDEIETHIIKILDLLELTSLANTLIGVKGNGGLSVEQAKRVTIAVELAANPSIIFLDEPTSGLDSRSALIVMRVIRNIASTGRTVICTIHQPSSEIFTMFDSLLLLKKGGETVYFGELGERGMNLVNYLQAIPGTQPIQPTANPATWMLEVIGAGVQSTDKDFAGIYRSSHLCQTNTVILEDLERSSERYPKLEFEEKFAASSYVQFTQLLIKVNRTYWRSPSYNLTRLILMIVIALLLGSIYWQVSDDTEGGVFSKTAVMFLASVFMGVINYNSVLPMAVSERAPYYRERSANMYSALVYDVTFALVEIPYLILSSLLFVCPFYFMVGLSSNFGKFISWYLVYFVETSFMTYFGILLSAALPNQETTTLLGSLFISLWNLFCGFMAPKDDIPAVWKFLYYFNPFTYTIQCLLSSEYHCSGDNCPKIKYLDRGSGKMVEDSVYNYAVKLFGLNYDQWWIYFIILIICLVVVRIGTYLSLRFVVHATR